MRVYKIKPVLFLFTLGLLAATKILYKTKGEKQCHWTLLMNIVVDKCSNADSNVDSNVPLDIITTYDYIWLNIKTFSSFIDKQLISFCIVQ